MLRLAVTWLTILYSPLALGAEYRANASGTSTNGGVSGCLDYDEDGTCEVLSDGTDIFLDYDDDGTAEGTINSGTSTITYVGLGNVALMSGSTSPFQIGSNNVVMFSCEANCSRVAFLKIFSNHSATLTVADSGDGSPATATLTPTANFMTCTCQDANSCDIAMGESDMQVGQVIYIYATEASPNTCDFTDSSGVSELAGNYSMDAEDTLTLLYTGSTFVELARSDN